MLLELLTFAFLASPAELSGAARLAQGLGEARAPMTATFLPGPREASNWRFEAAQNLDLEPQALARLVLGESGAPPRCVKLNNYWCVKRAGWAGEIAADAEGHVAFASAAEGAAVAAALLRRYYLVYNLRSAQAILSRWAPAQCGGAALSGRPSAARLSSLAPRGIKNTLRARWLAAHRPGSPARRPAKADPGQPASAKTAVAMADAAKAAPARPKIRMSIVIDRKTRMIEAPEIAVGMGERPASAGPMRGGAVRLASLDIQGLAPLLPAPSCSDETARVRNYALRAIAGIAGGPDEDLRLFAPDGAPGPNLSRLLLNMARVEIGPLGARAELIQAAVEAASEAARRPPGGP